MISTRNPESPLISGVGIRLGELFLLAAIACRFAPGQDAQRSQLYNMPQGVSAASFAIKGDGSDATKQIQDALTALSRLRDQSHGAAALYFPWGTSYGISSQIDIPDGVRIICPGPAFDGPGTMAVFKPLTNSITMFRTSRDNRQNRIEGCGFQGNGRTGIVFVYLDTCVQCSLERNVFREFDETSTAVKAGGSLYLDSGFNIFSGQGMSYDIQNEYSSVSSNTYYGCGVCTFHDDVINAGQGARVYGNALLWHHQDLELRVSVDSGGPGVGAALNLCDKVGTGPISIDGQSYFELTEDSKRPPAKHMSAIRACPTALSITDTQIYGAGNLGTAIKFDSYMYGFRATGIEFARWNTGIDSGQGFTSTDSPDTIVAGNYWVDVTTKLTSAAELNQATQITRAAPGHAAGIFSVPDYGYIFSQALVPASVRVATTSSSTALDLSLGNVFEVGLDGKPGIISGILGNAQRGNIFVVESECAGCITLTGNSQFHLSAGRNVTLPKNLPIWFVTVESGQAWEIGTATQSIPTTAANLPRCTSPLEGTTAPVTDSSTHAWGTPVAGGGSNHVRAYCDGSAWTVAGK